MKAYRDGTPAGATTALFADMVVQLKALGVEDGDVVVARIAETRANHRNMTKITNALRKAISRLNRKDVVVLTMPSDIDIHCLPRERVVEALRVLDDDDASVDAKDRACSVVSGQTSKLEYYERGRMGKPAVGRR